MGWDGGRKAPSYNNLCYLPPEPYLPLPEQRRREEHVFFCTLSLNIFVFLFSSFYRLCFELMHNLIGLAML